MQGRQGMANRLAASYAQDAALQQQLQMLNGSTGMAQPYAALNQQLQHVGMGHPADTLTLYQLQHQGMNAAAPQTLLTQRSFAGTPGIAVDGSGLLVQQQQPQLLQQSLQPQQAHLTAGGWVPAAAAGPQPGGLTRWGSGQMQLQQAGGAALTQAQAVTANAQLLAQLQVSSQAQQSGDALWMAAPASGGLLMGNNLPQGVMMQPQAAAVSAGMSMAGIPGLQTQQLMATQLQAAGPGAAGMVASAGAAAAAGQAGVSGAVNGHNLLDQYQSVSWSVLAAAQGEAALRDQLLTELVLLLTMLHTLSNTLKGSMAPADALSDFSYLAAAARRHMATFSRLSQAGNIAVQLLALVTPLALKHLNSAGAYCMNIMSRTLLFCFADQPCRQRVQVSCHACFASLLSQPVWRRHFQFGSSAVLFFVPLCRPAGGCLPGARHACAGQPRCGSSRDAAAPHCASLPGAAAACGPAAAAADARPALDHESGECGQQEQGCA
jgi:hypothetical protein